jgi:hypothetical protein
MIGCFNIFSGFLYEPQANLTQGITPLIRRPLCGNAAVLGPRSWARPNDLDGKVGAVACRL